MHDLAEEFKSGWLYFLEHINFEASNLDAESIRFMNEMPCKIYDVLKERSSE